MGEWVGVWMVGGSGRVCGLGEWVSGLVGRSGPGVPFPSQSILCCGLSSRRPTHLTGLYCPAQALVVALALRRLRRNRNPEVGPMGPALEVHAPSILNCFEPLLDEVPSWADAPSPQHMSLARDFPKRVLTMAAQRRATSMRADEGAITTWRVPKYLSLRDFRRVFACFAV